MLRPDEKSDQKHPFNCYGKADEAWMVGCSNCPPGSGGWPNSPLHFNDDGTPFEWPDD